MVRYKGRCAVSDHDDGDIGNLCHIQVQSRPNNVVAAVDVYAQLATSAEFHVKNVDGRTSKNGKCPKTAQSAEGAIGKERWHG